jgi:5'-AMP-activated protein kinase, catalytic alpha subunit
MKCRWSPGSLESMMHNGHSFGAESTIIEADDLIEKSNHTVKFEIQVHSECFCFLFLAGVSFVMLII